MGSNLHIHACETRAHRFFGRQYKRSRNHLTYKNAKGEKINLAGWREMNVNGHWFHQDLYYKYAASMSAVGVKTIRNHWFCERYDWMSLVKMPQIDIGSNNDSSGYVSAVAELFDDKILVMINDEFIGKIKVLLAKAYGDTTCEYGVAEIKQVSDSLENHKGQRAFTMNWYI